jgi:hypothetical protein
MRRHNQSFRTNEAEGALPASSLSKHIPSTDMSADNAPLSPGFGHLVYSFYIAMRRSHVFADNIDIALLLGRLALSPRQYMQRFRSPSKGVLVPSPLTTPPKKSSIRLRNLPPP